MPHYRDVVSLRGLFEQRRGASAVGALQVFENNDGDLRSLGRLQDGRLRILSERQRGQEQREQKDFAFISHKLF